MNTRTFTFTLILVIPLLALAQAPQTQFSEDQAIKRYWQQPLKEKIKPTLTQSCPQYIKTGQWVYRSAANIHEWALSLTPSICGRYIDPSETGLMFYEIVKKFGQSPYWTNNRGMINQLVCHLANAREKPEWNLEPFRPYVGYTDTVKAGCNPLVPKPDPDFD